MKKIDIPSLGGVFAAPWSVKKLLGLLAIFGPAAIVASVSIGADETIVVVRTGAWAGYGLLWLVLVNCLVKGIFVTYMLARYTAVSGEYIGHRLVHLPGPRGWLLILLVCFKMAIAPRNRNHPRHHDGAPRFLADPDRRFQFWTFARLPRLGAQRYS